MKTPTVITLKSPDSNYWIEGERQFRRDLEIVLSGLRDDLVDSRKKTSKDESLSLRRFQFLLMGAK